MLRWDFLLDDGNIDCSALQFESTLQAWECMGRIEICLPNKKGPSIALDLFQVAAVAKH